MGLAPGDRMKKIGTVGDESRYEVYKMSSAELELSQSTKESPLGRVDLMKVFNWAVTLSGLRHLVTSIFWKGALSRTFQSPGSLQFSGASSLYHSLKRRGISFSRWVANCSKGSILIKLWTEYQATSGSQSLRTLGLGVSVVKGQLTKKFIYTALYSSSRRPFCMRRKVRSERKICLWRSKRPRATHWKIVIRITLTRFLTFSLSSSCSGVSEIAL